MSIKLGMSRQDEARAEIQEQTETRSAQGRLKTSDPQQNARTCLS